MDACPVAGLSGWASAELADLLCLPVALAACIDLVSVAEYRDVCWSGPWWRPSAERRPCGWVRSFFSSGSCWFFGKLVKLHPGP